MDKQALLWVPAPAQDTWCLPSPAVPAAGIPRCQSLESAERWPGPCLRGDLGSAAPASKLFPRASSSCLRKWTLGCGLHTDMPREGAAGFERLSCPLLSKQVWVPQCSGNEDSCSASGPRPL
ncbi:uncharacterized protein LOC110592667 [Neomonachus schauinslandi]|uniref:Uncharacterized protein LOC110592667 n=1 Tax=Neomonachus schauinslandi TaxID=29088 RepID=A0A8M1MSA4_NEOSC|nr:uncharacterized protein LOC110592667 [Neomonachus schauinslandi]